MTTVFVIGLPGLDHRVVTVSLGDLFDDPGAFLAVTRVAEAIVSARAESSRVARASTASMSGWRSIIQRGGVAVGVPSTTRSPASPRISMAWSSQAHWKRPGLGSIRLHANSPIRTQPRPASRIRLASLLQQSRGHCSG